MPKKERNSFKDEVEQVCALAAGYNTIGALTDYAKGIYHEGFEEGYRVRDAENIIRSVADKTPTQRQIITITEAICDMLLHKNMKYGDSALHPIRVFSKLEAGNSICQRIDDKISRVRNSDAISKNDVADLMGYLILLCATKKWADFTEFMD